MHYVVIIGTTAEDFIINNPAEKAYTNDPSVLYPYRRETKLFGGGPYVGGPRYQLQGVDTIRPDPKHPPYDWGRYCSNLQAGPIC